MLLDHGCHRALPLSGMKQGETSTWKGWGLKRAIRGGRPGKRHGTPWEARPSSAPTHRLTLGKVSLTSWNHRFLPVKIKIKPPVLCHTAHRQGDSHRHGCHMDDVKAPHYTEPWFPSTLFSSFCHWSMEKVCIFSHIHDLWPLGWTL